MDHSYLHVWFIVTWFSRIVIVLLVLLDLYILMYYKYMLMYYICYKCTLYIFTYIVCIYVYLKYIYIIYIYVFESITTYNINITGILTKRWSRMIYRLSKEMKHLLFSSWNITTLVSQTYFSCNADCFSQWELVLKIQWFCFPLGYWFSTLLL